GDSNIGMWFFQNQVGPVAGGGFSGVHVNGDIFAVSAFTQGGGVSTIAVYKWDSSCASGSKNAKVGDCADANLRVLFDAAAVCGTAAACAIVDATPFTPAWPYATKFGGGSLVPIGGFYEGGFDLSSLLGGAQTPCFASFLLETRSSQETT